MSEDDFWEDGSNKYWPLQTRFKTGRITYDGMQTAFAYISEPNRTGRYNVYYKYPDYGCRTGHVFKTVESAKKFAYKKYQLYILNKL